MHFYTALTAAVTEAATTSDAAINLPTVAISALVGILSALLTSYTQRWSVNRALAEERKRRAEDARDRKVSALRAYEIALDDAARNLWSKEMREFTRIQFPGNLNALRIAARPFFSYVEKTDRDAFARMNALAGDGQTEGEDAREFSDARMDVLKVIADIEEDHNPSKS